MGVSIKWLRKYIDFDWQPEELAHKLTMAGVAIEGIEKRDTDTVMELDLTPNRGDCLGLINLAREVAALNGNMVKIPEVVINENNEDIRDYISIEISAQDLCKRYAARLIRNCEIKPSPAWMQEALLNSGIRPINNIVDVTNYVLLETNQPLHAFDYRLLGEQKRILVRKAVDKEEFTTLDGFNRELDKEMLVITDGQRPIALAGIMGGENTEINNNTTDVLLESANFLGTNIRKTSRKLGLRSESSARFEKGSDINGVLYAINRAAQLIQELAGGEIVKGIYDVYPEPIKPEQVTLRPNRVNYLLDTRLSAEEVKNYLEKLKFNVKEDGEKYIVDIPSYRPDIELEVDLIEEVARLYGYDRIPAKLPCGDTTQGGLTPSQVFREKVRTTMARRLNEVISYSFINPVAFDWLLIPEDSTLRNVVKVANPLSEEQSVMRTTLLPGLLETVSRNLARKNQNVAFFELGSIFYPEPEGLPVEKLHLGAVVTGSNEINWLKTKVAMDFFYLKGILEDLLRESGIEDYEFVQVKKPAYHPGRTAVLMHENEEIGIIGEVHPLVLQNYDIKARTCIFELDMEALYKLSKNINMVEEIAKFPGVERDIALLLAQDVRAYDVLKVIRKAEKELLQNIVVFDVYTGEQVPEGYKSIALKLTFQSHEKTLTDADVNNSIEKILADLKTELKAVLR